MIPSTSRITPAGSRHLGRAFRPGLVLLTAALMAGGAGVTTHTVVRGDTLWDITGHYLGDPFRWPGVWNLNPQIANPHLIYPGDLVRLDPSSPQHPDSPVTMRAAPPPVSPSDPLAGFIPGLDFQKVEEVFDDQQIEFIANRAPGMLNPEAVAIAPWALPDGEQDPLPASRLDWGPAGNAEVLLPGMTIAGAIGSEDGIRLGQILQVTEDGTRVLDHASEALPAARLRQTRALVEVVELRPQNILTRVLKVFGSVGAHARMRPFQPISTLRVASFEPAREEVRALVMANSRNGEVQIPGSFLILRANQDGQLRQGDILEIMDRNLERGGLAFRGFGIVVRAHGPYASLFLTGSDDLPVMVGDYAWLLRRAVQEN